MNISSAVKGITRAIGSVASDVADDAPRMVSGRSRSTMAGLQRATGGAGASAARAGADAIPSGPVHVDGTWLDALGNVPRGHGGGTWTGPDGQSFDALGNAARGGSSSWGSFTGPDGATYSGI